MSLDQGLRYESGFGFHNQLMASENYNRQFHGNYLVSCNSFIFSREATLDLAILVRPFVMPSILNQALFKH